MSEDMKGVAVVIFRQSLNLKSCISAAEPSRFASCGAKGNPVAQIVRPFRGPSRHSRFGEPLRKARVPMSSAGLTSDDEEVKRPPLTIAAGAQLGVHALFSRHAYGGGGFWAGRFDPHGLLGAPPGGRPFAS